MTDCIRTPEDQPNSQPADSQTGYTLPVATNLEAALGYASQGLLVLPLKVASKVPLLGGGKNAATKDGTTIRSQFNGAPGLNVGIRTGTSSGICVIDVDPRNGGEESFARLIKERGELPRTVEARTGGGGFHLVFRLPHGDHPWCGDRPNVGGYRGIDLKCDGYIVAAPSIHPSGRRYEWKDGQAPGEIDFAELPAALLDLVTKAERTQAPTQPAKVAEDPDEDRTDGKPDWNTVVSGCAFAKACVEDADGLPEPWWFAVASILAACEDGRKIFHTISSPHHDYDRAASDEKFNRALDGGPPRTCRTIEDALSFAGCRRCAFWATA